MTRTALIQIRVTPEHKKRIERAAKARFLEPSAWARSVVMQSVVEWEHEQGLDVGDEEDA